MAVLDEVPVIATLLELDSGPAGAGGGGGAGLPGGAVVYQNEGSRRYWGSLAVVAPDTSQLFPGSTITGEDGGLGLGGDMGRGCVGVGV